MTFVERRRLDAGSAVVNADDAPRKASHDARPPSRASANLVLAIVCVGIVLANLDLFIVNVALPRIGQDFRSATLEDLSWILNGYAIVYAALLVFFGRLAERHRRDRSFLLGCALSLASLFGCCVMWYLWRKTSAPVPGSC